MSNNIPEGYKPVYSPTVRTYIGLAEGGPNNGRHLSSQSLTIFIPRQTKRRIFDRHSTPISGLTESEQQSLEEAEKEAMAEAERNRHIPHRYDYDLERKVWVYIDYLESGS